MTRQQLNIKYPGKVNNDPLPDCPKCKGTGEHTKVLKPGEMTWCMCVGLVSRLSDERRKEIVLENYSL